MNDASTKDGPRGMMHGVLISAEEYEALGGLDPFVGWLYVMAIRPRMDIQTGLVGGRHARISWRALMEWVAVEPRQGITNAGLPAKSKVRRAVEQLERAGLVARVSDGGYLVFRCLHARVGFSATKKAGTNPAQQAGIGGGVVVPINTAAYERIDYEAGTPEVPKAGTHQRSEEQENTNVFSVVHEVADCPHQEIVNLWNARLAPPCLPVKIWTGKDRRSLRARWRSDPKRQTLGYWGRLFDYVGQSRRLTGGLNDPRRPPFVATLRWLVDAQNFANVVEGVYHR